MHGNSNSERISRPAPRAATSITETAEVLANTYNGITRRLRAVSKRYIKDSRREARAAKFAERCS